MSNLIGLTGFAGAGKDQVAALLKMKGYTRFAFADAVRKEVVDSFEEGYPIPVMPDHIFSAWLTCANAALVGDDLIYTKPMTIWGRQLLQYWGMMRREQDSQYWINIVNEQLYHFSGDAVISDVRFVNEAERICHQDTRWNGAIWRVERPGCKSDGHVSETELLQIEPDYVIHNDGDLQHLAVQVLRGLKLYA